MEKIWVKFTKAHEKYAIGEIVELEKAVGDSLILLKIAEATQSPENDIINKALDGLSTGFQAALEKGVALGIEKSTSVIEKRLPAIPIDHTVEAQRGFQHFGEFLDCVKKSKDTVDPRLMLVKGTPSGQSVQNDVEGGYLVPDVWSKAILERAGQGFAIQSRTDQRTTSSNNLKINTMVETSRKDGYRHNGVLAYWMDEADQYTASTVKFNRMGLNIHKLGVLCYCTEEELSDASANMEAILTRKAGDAIRFTVNKSLFDGTGVGQPLGLLRSPSLITVGIESNQAGEPGIMHRNLAKMRARLHVDYRSGAIWMVHPNLEEKLEFISFNDDSTNQRPVYMPSNGISVDGYSTLYGLPVVPCEFCNDLGQKGDIVLANWSQYITLTKAGEGVKSASSIHVRFLYDELAYKFSYRIGGQAAWPTAVEDLKGTRTRSPFVTLAARSGEGTSSGL